MLSFGGRKVRQIKIHIPKWPCFSILLPARKLALVASLFKLKFKRILTLNKGTRANLQANKRILKWWPL